MGVRVSLCAPHNPKNEPVGPRERKREMERKMKFWREKHEKGVFGAKGLSGSFKSKILPVFSLIFLNVLLVIGS